ncbi:pirin family protein [Sphingomonas sp. MG17]|uniref:Pirin family protein n=1 Tax=Sphingomonas tagetis TaxID=2949092 RepID=A0A9X2HRR7_9SPHN|nr:pirin family protein [Sphingomonas tagetis]
MEALHHFCFAGYHALGREGWGLLSVLNHVTLAPHAGLRPQPIDGVEQVLIVRKGAIAHSGSMGGNCRTLAGEVELISPGPGITHADVNPSARTAEYIEIRIRCDDPGERAQRKTVKFPGQDQNGELILFASGLLEDRPAMVLHAPARLSAARVPTGGTLEYAPFPGRHVYILSLKGQLAVNGIAIDQLEGAAVADEPLLRIKAKQFAEMLIIDTP